LNCDGIRNKENARAIMLQLIAHAELNQPHLIDFKKHYMEDDLHATG